MASGTYFQPHLSNTSFEMREMRREPTQIVQAASALVGGEQHIAGGEGEFAPTRTLLHSEEAQRHHGHHGHHAAWVWWHYWVALWMIAITALSITGFVIGLVAYLDIQSYQKSNGKNIHELDQCCADSTSNITNIYTQIEIIEESIVDVENDVLSIFSELASLQNQTTANQQCCLNNTLSIQTLNTELYNLDVRVGFNEADIDVLQQNVGDIQIQLDNL